MTIAMENQVSIRRHKGTGIASFVIGITSVISVLALIGAAGLIKPTPELHMFLGLGVIFACLVDFIGIGLGFFGAVDRSSKKAFPVLGLSLNIGILVIFASLVVIGLSMKAH
jgi:hypothetical protein